MSNVESRAVYPTARQVPHSLAEALATAGVGRGGSEGAWAGRDGDRLGHMIEHELVPRLLLAHRAGAFPPFERLAAARHGIAADDFRTFVERVLGHDEDAPEAFVETLLARGVTVEAVYLDLLAPTAVQLGQLWDADECDFLEVTVALGRIQRVLRELSPRFAAGGRSAAEDARILLSSLPGEQHTLGLYMVAEFFLRDGWGVQVGAPASDEELSALVRDVWFDVVGFSVACESRLLKVRREIASVRRHAQNPRLIVVVGGRVFAENPELVARVGADGYAASAAEAPTRARDLLGRPRS